MTPTLLNIGGIEVEVVRRRVKNLNLSVSPPYGRVRVSVPTRFGDAEIQDAVISSLDWIHRQQKRLRTGSRTGPPTLVDGETHLVWGTGLRLIVIENSTRNRVARTDDALVMQLRPTATHQERHRVLDEWYRVQLSSAIPPLIEQWSPLIGADVWTWGIRKMSTRWGSCDPQAHRITLGLDLAQGLPKYLEYVVVHEMAHIIESRHDRRFYRLMEGLLPGWKKLRAELNQGFEVTNPINPSSPIWIDTLF